MERLIITREEARARGLKRYFTGKPCKRDHAAERYVSNSSCLECDLLKVKAWNESNQSYVQNRRAQLSGDPFSLKNSRSVARYMLRKARGHAKECKIKFSLTLRDILLLPVHCSVLGYKLVYLVSKDNQGCVLPHSASLDRIDNTRGYTSGNVQIISWRANHLKADATIAELKAVLTHCEIYEAFPF